MIAHKEHDVRIVPQGSIYYVLCCCGWDYHAKDRIEAGLELDLHVNPHRQGDDMPWKSEAQRRRERRERAERRKGSR